MSANQNDVTQHETFQLEYEAKGDRWCISTFEGKYWAFGAASTVQASNSASAGSSDRAYFRLVWNTDDGTCSLMALEPSSGGQLRSLGARKSGQLFTGGPESIRFYVKFLNRTSISLRGANASGFVGTKGQGKLQLRLMMMMMSRLISGKFTTTKTTKTEQMSFSAFIASGGGGKMTVPVNRMRHSTMANLEHTDRQTDRPRQRHG